MVDLRVGAAHLKPSVAARSYASSIRKYFECRSSLWWTVGKYQFMKAGAPTHSGFVAFGT
eukprot:6177323-Pleurochrysis_carterae.AAC.3